MRTSLAGLAALVLVCPRLSMAAPPSVTQVEPPGWWAGHSLAAPRLLIRGRDLAGARLESDDPDLAPGPVTVSASGTWLFADLRISPTARPGPRNLRVVSPEGAARAGFELYAPLPRAGRFSGFGPDDVIYLVMPDRFANGDTSNDDPARSRGLHDRADPRRYHGGDLAGIEGRLPYLRDLGVTALWLNPVYDNADVAGRTAGSTATFADYHGYGAVDFYAVDEHLGDVDGLRRLVDAAHALGLKVIQDQVANHTGPLHPWVLDPPTPAWFNGDARRHRANSWRKWSLLSPYAAPELGRATLEGWFIDLLPDLDQRDPETARYLTQNSLWWVGRTGLDGVRQDTLSYLDRGWVRDWMAALKREHPRLRVVGEVFDMDPALVAFWQGGRPGHDGVDTGVDSLGDFPVMEALHHAFVEGKPMTELPARLARDWVYPDPARLVPQLGSHDEPRFMSRPGATTAALRLAFAFLLTTRGIPMIYSGDELGLEGGPDPDNRRDFPGGWPGDARDAFTARGRTPEAEAVHAHVRRLLALRRELAPLRRGRLWDLHADDETYVYAREHAGHWVVVALNKGAKPAQLDVPLDPLTAADGPLEDRLRLARGRVESGRLRAEIPPLQAAVFVPAR